MNLFTDYYNQKLENAQAYSKKKILFIGRYTEFKGLLELWKVFSDLVEEKQLDWELVCLGTGNLHPVNHPQIKHVGFVQPSELFSYLEEASFFVLPSRVEPWGVIVHEMASAGLPLILSDQVGASEAFLIPGENGWSFKSKDYQSLKRVLYSAMSTDPSMLKEMGSRSHMLSRLVHQTQWVNTVASLVRK